MPVALGATPFVLIRVGRAHPGGVGWRGQGQCGHRGVWGLPRIA